MSRRDDFIARFGGVFEHSPWVAEDAYDADLPSALTADGLHRLLCAAMRAAPRERKLALIAAHPDLAGRLLRIGRLTDASSAEQASAGLDRLNDSDFESFTALNRAYRDKFGIPFVMAVKGRTCEEILAAFKTRLRNDEAAEFEIALTEIERIAWLRITDIMNF